MRHLFSKSTRNDDGTLTIPAWAADRWQRQMTTRYADLPAAAQDSDRAEADRILGITPGRRRRRKVKRVVSMKPLVGRCNYDLNGYSHRQFWRLVRDLTSCGWTVTIQAQEDRRPWEKQTKPDAFWCYVKNPGFDLKYAPPARIGRTAWEAWASLRF
jgi:hypothetical protein